MKESEGKTAYECGRDFYEHHIKKNRAKLNTLSEEFDTYEYIQVLEQWEIDTMRLRQLNRRKNMKLIK